MTWQHGRGRPRKKNAEIVTPELKRKHASGITKECIDVLKERGVITPQQHWCAMHFRWLYTIRYGLPAPTAINLEECLSGVSSGWQNNESRRVDLEAEFIVAAKELSVSGALRHIMSVAVYGIFPHQSELEKLKTGLNDLALLWNKSALHPFYSPARSSPSSPSTMRTADTTCSSFSARRTITP